MHRKLLLIAATLGIWQAAGQGPGPARTYLVKLSVPVSTNKSKPGDRIRAAIVSPEILLNGYLEGEVQEAGRSKLVLKFSNVLYKGKSTSIESVSSASLIRRDTNPLTMRRPIKLEAGLFSSAGSDFWLDEGAELRVQATPARK